MGDATFGSVVGGRGRIEASDPSSELMPGWAPLLAEALDEVGRLLARHPGSTIRWLGVKEKLGTLRIHAVADAPESVRTEASRIWRAAERRSEVTCQVCGRPGRLRPNRAGWLSTTCDDDA